MSAGTVSATPRRRRIEENNSSWLRAARSTEKPCARRTPADADRIQSRAIARQGDDGVGDRRGGPVGEDQRILVVDRILVDTAERRQERHRPAGHGLEARAPERLVGRALSI